MAKRKDEEQGLTVAEVRVRSRKIVYVQRGLMHDEPSMARYAALDSCAQALACYSMLLDYEDKYDVDFIHALQIAANIAAEAGDNKNFHYLLRCSIDAQVQYEVKQGESSVKPRNGVAESLSDDLYDGWIWDPDTQGFVNDDITDNDSDDGGDFPDLFGNDSDDQDDDD